MKKPYLLITLLLIAILMQINFSFAVDKPNIIGESAILIDYSSGQILYEKDAYSKFYPSSTTKILTALIILENHKLDEVVTIDSNSPYVEGSKIFIFEDEKLTVEQLLNAMLIASANDCAEALAVYHSGSIEAFADAMNERAKELGASNSNFVSPHGLHDDNHYTTAYDLSLITREAYKNPIFQEIVAKSFYSIEPTEYQPETRNMQTTNHFLASNDLIYYEGKYIPVTYKIVDGIKTGYTTMSKNNLVSTAQKNGIRLISIVFKSDANSIYSDSRKLLDYGFDTFKYHSFTFSGNKITSTPIENATKNNVDLFADQTISGLIPNDFDVQNIEEVIQVEPLSLPISENQILGSVEYYAGEQFVGRANLMTDESIEEKTLLITLKNTFIKKNGLGQIEYGYYLNIFFNILISFIIWRTVITIWKIRQRKKKKKIYS
ncbi:MAG: D-alanyl-D-alanine carboxypeptidase [Clostridiales bacterium]|nr:D-alanyl-D-alanine carboxypeptidase [Clostridiales bacterium]